MKTKGFTLIELMVVVGIIGILVSIAAPNYARYQSKARQSEAKIALGAIYDSEQAFYSEYSAFIPSLDAIGYASTGTQTYYSLGWSGASNGTQVTGFTGAVGNSSLTSINDPFSGCTSSLPLSGTPLGTTANPQSFTVNALGCLRSGNVAYDSWFINDGKFLQNSQLGL